MFLKVAWAAPYRADPQILLQWSEHSDWALLEQTFGWLIKLYSVYQKLHVQSSEF